MQLIKAEVFNYCDDNNFNFAIGGQLDKSVVKQINQISNWEELSKYEDMGEFIHTMNPYLKCFCMIVIRRNITPMFQKATFRRYSLRQRKHNIIKERLHVMATNNNTLSKEEIIKLYRQRGETSENKIKEFKNGFNMDYLPSKFYI